jgi:hypothetical protein
MMQTIDKTIHGFDLTQPGAASRCRGGFGFTRLA